MRIASEVVAAIVEATTPGKKAKARRFLNEYLAQQRAEDKFVCAMSGLKKKAAEAAKNKRTLAAIKAVITRYHDSKHNGML